MIKNESKSPATPAYLQLLTVARCPFSRKGWAIVRIADGTVEEGGFFSKARAWEYLHKEYNLTVA
jgi:hypothetical protein